MIISHVHKYVFIELPLAASTAISSELRTNYSGESILYKHATYQDFLRTARAPEKAYFAFSGMRNPLDKAVSHYFKYKTDHKQQFSRAKRTKGMTRLGFGIYNFLNQQRISYIEKNSADFPSFFKQFYLHPYGDWSIVSHKHLDFLIRFESLQADFAKALELMGVSQVRPLPTGNRTAEKAMRFEEYYSPEIIPSAAWVFGPYMDYWGYEFPKSWGKIQVSKSAKLLFTIENVPKKIYWKYFRNKVYRSNGIFVTNSPAELRRIPETFIPRA